AVRKRKTEVDAQIAPISALGAAVGIPTPAIDRLVALIHDIEDGRRPQSWETLDLLLDACSTISPTAAYSSPARPRASAGRSSPGSPPPG
ncbi:ketopantoate reductase C-terminal domain-containing protein, partial [Acinetobacter baumannii]